MRKALGMTAAVLIGIGALATSPEKAEAHRGGGAIAGAVIGGLALGALAAGPAWGYGYYPSYYYGAPRYYSYYDYGYRPYRYGYFYGPRYRWGGHHHHRRW